jgi:predicted extracellular nuclease
MKKIILSLFVASAVFTSAKADLIISQYYEGNAGTNRVLELWNTGVTDIDLSVTNLLLENFFNGGAVANSLTINTGTIAAGDFFVITNLDAAGTTGFTNAGLTANFTTTSSAMNFNGDDALVLSLGGVVVDSLGQKGVDPGSAWTTGSVSTANQNISLLSGITTGRTSPTDPFDVATRFQFVATADQSAASFSGFTPAAVPEPGTVALIGLGLGVVVFGARRRRVLG